MKKKRKNEPFAKGIYFRMNNYREYIYYMYAMYTYILKRQNLKWFNSLDIHTCHDHGVVRI